MYDALGQRMKDYEKCYDYSISDLMPVIIRLDGRAFHTYTKGKWIIRPFDRNLHHAMAMTVMDLCGQIQGARMAYTQSDEISIFVYPKKVTSEPWFGNRLQKMVSIAAATATMSFNQYMKNIQPEDARPLFDARVFTLPTFEVSNYFWWRQADAIRNSKSMLAQYYFSHKSLHGKSCEDMLKMLMEEKNIDWHALDEWKKYGCVVYKSEYGSQDCVVNTTSPRWAWHPAWVFLENRQFFDKLIEQPTHEP